MKKKFGFIIGVVAFVIVFAFSSPVQAGKIKTCPGQGYRVTGDVTSDWGAEGGDLWYDVLKETASSTAGGYDDATTPPVYGVMVRPPSSIDLPNSVNPTNHNWVEVNYLLVSGKYGQRTLYSVGELDPRFGNKPVTLTKDKKGYELSGLGRCVRGVSTIDVVHAFTNIKGVPNDARPYAPWIVVSGGGIAPRTYDLTALQTMPQVTFDASTSTSNTYGIWTGPRLVDVLRASGVDTEDTDSYIVVQGADGYATVYSMYEVTHKIGIQDLTTCPACEPGYVMLAVKDGSAKNTLNNGTCADAESAGTVCKDGGIVRTVVPGDWQAGRWISNAAQIIVHKLGR